MIKEDLHTPFLEQVQEILLPLQESRAFFEYQRQLALATAWNDRVFRLKNNCQELLKQIEQRQMRLNKDLSPKCT